MMKYTLYGDGIHDDTDAIQEMLDTGASLIELPVPKDKYLISRTLLIGSHQTLKLPNTATIRLMDNSNCLMLRNKGWHDYDEDIAVIGGIWDMNNIGQEENPMSRPFNIDDYVTDEEKKLPKGEYNNVYFGVVMRLSHVKRLRVSEITYKDPVTFCLQIQHVEYFTVENINFDFNMGNPYPLNMDGIHLDGCCRYGVIRNLQGRCYDDLLAINADDCGVWGDITDIEVDGIFSDNCHSAVRLLTTQSKVKNISISNVYGTYYQYCIGFTYYYIWERQTRGIYQNISLNNIFATKAPRPSYLMKDHCEIFAPIYIDERLDITKITLNNINRTETNVAAELILVKEDTVIDNLSVTDVYQDSEDEFAAPVLLNHGVINNLYMNNVYNKNYKVIENDGTIKKEIIN